MFLILNNMNSKKIIMVGLMSILLTACGGGGGGTTTVVPDDTTTEVKLDVEDLNIKLDSSYSIIIENQSIPFSETGSLKLDVDKNNTTPIIVANKEGRTILLGRKFSGDNQAEISLESTAEVFILRTTAFFGVKITDDKELSKRIRSHKVFPELVNQLKKGINEGSTCPTDPKCNPWALVLSSKITSTLDMKDLVGDK